MTKPRIIRIMREQKGWFAQVAGNDIELHRVYGIKISRKIKLTLRSIGNGNYYLEHPNYDFANSISHFKPIEEEKRLSLNKNILKSVVSILRKTTIWECVENKDFLLVNDNNSKSNKRDVKRELKDLLA